jgi:hypothetical protein
MSFITPDCPNLPDFITFCRAQGVTTGILPDDSQYFIWAFEIAVKTCLRAPCMGVIYTLAVYNLGMHTLVYIAQDTPPSTFFADLRKSYKMLSFVLPVSNAFDQGTGEGNVVPKFLENITLAGLGYLSTPWGRWYLAYSQQYGPNIFGVS